MESVCLSTGTAVLATAKAETDQMTNIQILESLKLAELLSFLSSVSVIHTLWKVKAYQTHAFNAFAFTSQVCVSVVWVRFEIPTFCCDFLHYLVSHPSLRTAHSR